MDNSRNFLAEGKILCDKALSVIFYFTQNQRMEIENSNLYVVNQ